MFEDNEIDIEKSFEDRLVPLDDPAFVAFQKKRCWCHTCRPITIDDMRMVLCPSCGNKRCPRATDHNNACTNSNDAGQEGSVY